MRYLILSDIHGCYDKLIKALECHNYDRDKDTIIFLGDAFDRGPDSLKVLNFLLDVPHLICLYGNHDIRLKDLFERKDYAEDYDVHNGVDKTLNSFIVGHEDLFDPKFIAVRHKKAINYMLNIIVGNHLEPGDKAFKELIEKLNTYWNKCAWAVEFKDFVATHAWVPTKPDEYAWWDYGLSYKYWDKWREESTDEIWRDAVWTDPGKAIRHEGFLPDKKLIVGHRHSWWIAQVFLDMPIYDSDTDEFKAPEEVPKIREYKNTIFIDGGAFLNEGDILIYEYETNEKPVIYKQKAE